MKFKAMNTLVTASVRCLNNRFMRIRCFFPSFPFAFAFLLSWSPLQIDCYPIIHPQRFTYLMIRWCFSMSLTSILWLNPVIRRWKKGAPSFVDSSCFYSLIYWDCLLCSFLLFFIKQCGDLLAVVVLRLNGIFLFITMLIAELISVSLNIFGR